VLVGFHAFAGLRQLPEREDAIDHHARDAEIADPSAIDMHRIGTVANVVRYLTPPDGSHHMVVQGEQRFQIREFMSGWPFLVARVVHIPEPDSRSPEIEARMLNLKRQAVEALQLLPQAPQELTAAIEQMTSPAALADLAVAYMDVKADEKQEILETIDVVARMEKVSRLLAQRIEVLRLSQEIGRLALFAFAELDQAIAKAGMPKEVEDAARAAAIRSPGAGCDAVSACHRRGGWSSIRFWATRRSNVSA